MIAPHVIQPWRSVFALAAAYNLAFGVSAVVWPSGFFRWFDLPAPQYPWIWSCLGMVIGVYGLGFAHVALRPEKGDVIAALGLLGKVLGPIGWLAAVGRAEMPANTFPMILANDLIWWFPFLYYLLRHHPERRAIVTVIVAVLHLAASVMLLMVRPGTEIEPSLELRKEFIASAGPWWVTCWFLWSCSSFGLLAFMVIWAARLRELGASGAVLWAACAACAAGLVLDLISETVAIVVLTDPLVSTHGFALAAREATTLGAGYANGLYCLGGVALSGVSWRLGFQRGIKLILGWVMWINGFLLSLAAFTGNGKVMTVCGAFLMVLFVLWAALTALDLRSAPVARP